MSISKKIRNRRSALRLCCLAMIFATAGLLVALGTMQAQNTTNASVLNNVESSIFTHVPDSSQLEFFPLQVGNIWEYRSTVGGRMRRTRIQKDTVLANGYKYFQGGFDWMTSTTFFVRIDSLLRVVYYSGRSCESTFPGVRQWENIPDGYSYYHLDEPEGTSWWVCNDNLAIMNHDQTLVHYSGIGQQFVIGEWRDTKDFRMGLIHGSTDTSYEYTCVLARGLGIIYEAKELDNMHLVGARINGQVYGTITMSVDNPSAVAEFLEIDPCYPNPAVSEAHVGFSVSQPAIVDVDLYDIHGVRVRSLERNMLCDGRNVTSFGVHGLASGQYICRIRAHAGASTEVKNVMVSIVK